MYKIKAAHDELIYLRIKVYLARVIEGFVLLCDVTLFLLKSFESKNILHDYFQSDYHLSHLAYIHWCYLIYFFFMWVIAENPASKKLFKTMFSIAECCSESSHITINIWFLENIWAILWMLLELVSSINSWTLSFGRLVQIKYTAGKITLGFSAGKIW